MKVKITGCSDNDYWYIEEKGKEFDNVKVHNRYFYKLDINGKYLIRKSDCEILSEIPSNGGEGERKYSIELDNEISEERKRRGYETLQFDVGALWMFNKLKSQQTKEFSRDDVKSLLQIILSYQTEIIDGAFRKEVIPVYQIIRVFKNMGIEIEPSF